MANGKETVYDRADGVPEQAAVREGSPQPEQESVRPGRRMTEERVLKSIETLKKYKSAKAALDARILSNERWYRLHQWDDLAADNGLSRNEPAPTSGYTLNVIMNKHADAMDNKPAPAVLPREQSDEDAAKVLSDILPVILDRNGWGETYSDLWWAKLKYGTGVAAVMWDNAASDGLGDICVRRADLLNLFWEPGVTDVQRSRNLYYLEIADVEDLRARYPEKKEEIRADRALFPSRYAYSEDSDADNDKTTVVDWYYKIWNGTRQVLHYCKFVGETVLYASEEDPQYAQRGFYDHGQYPFVFDVQFPVDGSPAGIGYIDLCKSPQAYIDKLDQNILRWSMAGSRLRWFQAENCKVDLDAYKDWRKDFVPTQGSGDPTQYLKPIEIGQIPGIYAEIRNLKVEELKEVSANRDFNQGATSSGVTAASAIAALQETGSKTSRDMITASRRAFVRLCEMVIELIRQFYTEDRVFRVTGRQGEGPEYVRFSSAMIGETHTDVLGEVFQRVPVFDIKVEAEKANPFSTMAQNETAMNLYGAGILNPANADQALMALELMTFEGKEKLVQRLKEGQTLVKTVQGLQSLLPQIMLLAQQADAAAGTQIAPKLAQALREIGLDADVTAGPVGAGAALQEKAGSQADQARERAAQVASPA